jgi:hypothetical protein
MPVELADLAEGQCGFVTMRQADDAGVGDLVQSLITNGVAEAVTPDVFRLRAGGRHPLPRLYAAWLALAPATPAWARSIPGSGVVSHYAAIRLYRVGDLPGPQLEFTFPGDEPTPSVDPNVRIHQAALPPEDLRTVESLPVTSPRRTLADIADRLDGGDMDRLLQAFATRR